MTSLMAVTPLPAGAISLGDANNPGPGTSLTQTLTYTAEAARGALRTASSAATFSNGRANGINAAAASVAVSLSAQSVAPVGSISTAPTSLGPVRVGTSASGNTAGFGTSATNASLSNLANGDGPGAISIQFVNKDGSGAAQLRIETDEGAALGGAGAVYVYNLIWTVPEPGTIAVFGAGLLGLAISRQNRRGRAFVALTAKPDEEETPQSAR